MGHVLMACRCGVQTVPADELEVHAFLFGHYLTWQCPCGADLVAYVSEPLAAEVLSWQRAGKDAAVAAWREQIDACPDLVEAIAGGGA